MIWRIGQLIVVVLASAVAGACVAGGTPSYTPAPSVARFAEYPAPEIPADVVVPDAVRMRHTGAWNRLQSGDLRAASRDFGAVLIEMPDLYPAQTGLGFVNLADGQFDDAVRWFMAALAANDRYLPAWVGAAEALLGLGRDAEAITAMERILVLDPQREVLRTRIELVRFRLTQSSIEAGQRLRAERRYDEAIQQFSQALAHAPDSTMILNELAQTEIEAGRLDAAEQHARRAVQVEPGEARWHAALGAVLVQRERFAEAADAYASADRLESNAEWRERSRTLREEARLAALPKEFRHVATATALSRGDVAAFIGVNLSSVIDRAPARVTAVATDIRDHWAAPWILPVTRAGIMTIFPNHTFQPSAPVRRGDLATVAAALIRLVGASRPAELARWQTARPQFPDLPPAHVFYPSAALATTVKVMTADPDGRFDPTRPATGQELEAAVSRITELAGQ